MSESLHIAITRRVRPEHVAEFESALATFASRSLAEPGSRGVHLLHPPPGSEAREYGILRSFATADDRDAFYQSSLYQEWVAEIEPLVEGHADYRKLTGLEAWFRDPAGGHPPVWKMALLTWIAVWPVSMIVPAALGPLLTGVIPGLLVAGAIAAGITAVLTWIAMPLLVRLAHPWLQPNPISNTEIP